MQTMRSETICTVHLVEHEVEVAGQPEPVTIGGRERIVDLCSECKEAHLGPLEAFLEAYGETPRVHKRSIALGIEAATRKSQSVIVRGGKAQPALRSEIITLSESTALPAPTATGKASESTRKSRGKAAKKTTAKAPRKSRVKA